MKTNTFLCYLLLSVSLIACSTGKRGPVPMTKQEVETTIAYLAIADSIDQIVWDRAGSLREASKSIVVRIGIGSSFAHETYLEDIMPRSQPRAQQNVSRGGRSFGSTWNNASGGGRILTWEHIRVKLRGSTECVIDLQAEQVTFAPPLPDDPAAVKQSCILLLQEAAVAMTIFAAKNH